MTVDRGLGRRIQLRLQAGDHVREPGIDAMLFEMVRLAAWRHIKGVLLRQHPAPGVAEDVKAVQPECLTTAAISATERSIVHSATSDGQSEFPQPS